MAVSAVAGLISAVSAAAASSGFFAALFGTVGLKAFAIGAGLSAVSRALAPKPNLGAQLRGITQTTRNPAGSRQLVYGQMRVGGQVVFISQSGDDNKYLHLAIAFASHEIESYEEIWFNDKQVWTQSGGFQSNWGTCVTIDRKFGTATQTASTDLVNSNAQWTTDHKLSGIAYIAFRLEWDADKFPQGVPNISAVLKGKKVYDPRVGSHSATDSSTWTYSRNPALCLRDYLVSSFGLAENYTLIDTTTLTAAADLCEESISLEGGGTQDRYELNGVIDTANQIKANIEQMLSAMGGKITYSGGKYFVEGAAYKAPTVTFDEADCISDIQTQTKQSRRSVYNGVKGIFVSEEKNYKVLDYPAQISSTYATQDGDPIFLDMPLPFVTNNVQAQRLAKIALLKSRQQVVITMAVNLKGLRVKVGDTINVTNARLGYSSKVFEVIDYALVIANGGSLGVNFTCIETASAVYDWSTSDEEDFLSGGELDLYDGRTVDNVTSLAFTEIGLRGPDGRLKSAVELTWTAPDDAFVEFYTIRYNKNGTTEYFEVQTRQTRALIEGLDIADNYDFQVKAQNLVGVQSSGTSLTNQALNGDTAAPSAPTGVTLTAGINQITCEWTNPTDIDLAFVEVHVTTTSTTPSFSASPTAKVGGEEYIATGLSQHTRFFHLRAVDFSGNKSAYTTQVSATSLLATSSDIADNAIGSDQIANDAVGIDQIANDSVGTDQLTNAVADIVNDAASRTEILNVQIESGDVLDLETGQDVLIQNLGDVAIFVNESNTTLNSSISTVQTSLSNLENTIVDLTSGTSDIFVQASAPVAGVGGIPDPIPDFSRWYDSDENNEPYYWDGTQWVELSDPRIANNASAITTLQSGLNTANSNISANSTAISALDTTTVSQGTSINSLSSDVTTLQSSLSTAQSDIGTAQTDITTNATAISGLTTRVTSTEGSITSITSDVTTLQSDMTTAQGDITTNSTAIGGLTTRMTTAEGNISTNSTDITALESTVNNASTGVVATSNALSGLTTRVTTAEGNITTNATDITALESTVNDASTGVAANASAVSSLDTRVTSAEGSITSLSSDVTTLQSDMTSAEGDITTNASAITALTTRVTTAEGSITTNTSDITTLETTVNDSSTGVAANATAISGLDTRVTTAEGNITSISSDVTTLQSDLTTAEGDITTNATGLTNLTTRVTTAEGDISTNASDITSLATSLTTTNSNVTTNATAISGLDTRLTSAEGTITSQASDITTLQSDLTTLEGDVTTNAGAITNLTTRVTTAEGSITSQASDITTLQSELDTAETNIDTNSTAISGLTTRVTSAEGNITSQASDITALETTVNDGTTGVAANASAISSLNTRVTTAEGNITSSASDITTLEASLNDLTTIQDEQDNVIETEAGDELLLNLPTDVASATSTATNALDARVTSAEGSITSQASDITTLQSDVTSAEGNISTNATAITGLTTRVTTAEGNITSNSSDITTLQSDLTTAEGDITTNATAISGLNTRVTSAEGTITSQASDITTLQSGLTTAQDDISTNASDISTNASSISTNATAISGLDTRVTSAEGSITSQASDITSLQSDLSTAEGNISTNATAITGLTTRVTAAEGNITTLSSDVTTLQSDLTTAEGDISTNSTAITNLTTRVTTAEGNITSNASDITTLQTNLTTTNGNVSTNATAISGLDTRVTSAEGSITSQAADITSLQSDVTTAEGDILTNATAITGLDTRVTTAEGNITSQASDITTLQSDLTSAEGDISTNATAISGLDTRVTSAEGSITSQASDITTLQSDLSDVETDLATAQTNISTNATAISALTTRVTSAEGAITSQSSDITQLQSDLSDAESDITATSTALTDLTTRVTTAEGNITSNASDISSLTSTINDPTTGLAATATVASGASTTAAANATAITDLEAEAFLTVSAGGNISGFKATADATGSSFTIQADQFKLVSDDESQTSTPFAVNSVDGTVSFNADVDIDGNLIVSGTVDVAQYAAGSLGLIDGITNVTDDIFTYTELFRTAFDGDVPHIADSTVTNSTNSNPAITQNVSILGNSPIMTFDFTTHDWGTGTRPFLLNFIGNVSSGVSGAESEMVIAFVLRKTTSPSAYTSTTASDYAFTTRKSTSGVTATVGTHQLGGKVNLDPNSEYYAWVFIGAEPAAGSLSDATISISGINK